MCDGVKKILNRVSVNIRQSSVVWRLSINANTKLLHWNTRGNSGEKSHSLRRHQLTCLQHKPKTHNRATGYLVKVGVSGDIVAPFLGIDEGFPFLLGLVHLGVHRFPSGQTVFRDVASLNSANVNCHECNKWIRKCERPYQQCASLHTLSIRAQSRQLSLVRAGQLKHKKKKNYFP